MSDALNVPAGGPYTIDLDAIDLPAMRPDQRHRRDDWRANATERWSLGRVIGGLRGFAAVFQRGLDTLTVAALLAVSLFYVAAIAVLGPLVLIVSVIFEAAGPARARGRWRPVRLPRV